MKKQRLSIILSAAVFLSMSLAAPLSASADDILKGDANNDGYVDLDDASAVLDTYAGAAAGLETAGYSEAADVDEDGKITLDDAVYILSYYAQTAAGLAPEWNALLGIDEGIDVTVSMTGLNSTYALLLDAQTGEVIAEKNGYATVYPASMTKIMTAILTIESFEDMNTPITMPYAALSAAWSGGGSTAGFGSGANITVLDLVYGMLLPSGCECCFAAAYEICGSEAAFVELMNQKAQELGMTGTHYANCTGLPNSNHYTTPYDMTLLMQYAIQNDIFRMVDTTQSYTATNGLYMRSTMFKSLINNYGTTLVTGGQILGGKTGTTTAAGSCLTSFAEIYGREYILCTTKASGGGRNTGDARTVYNRLGNALS